MEDLEKFGGRIASGQDDFRQAFAKEDLLILYFSGHGVLDEIGASVSGGH